MHVRKTKRMVEFPINDGADVNVEATNDCTASLLVAGSGNEKIVELLINAGANVQKRGASDDEIVLIIKTRKR